MVTSDDEMVKPKFNALWAYDGIGSQDKALAVFDKGGHMLFAGDVVPQFNVAQSLTTAFFLHILKGNPAGKAAVLSDGVSFPGLTYKTTLHQGLVIWIGYAAPPPMASPKTSAHLLPTTSTQDRGRDAGTIRLRVDPCPGGKDAPSFHRPTFPARLPLKAHG